MKEEYNFSKDIVIKRSQEIKKVETLFQFDKCFNLKLKPAGLNDYLDGEIINMVSDIIKQVQPTTIILPYWNDIHSDHKVVFDNVFACTKKFRYPYIKKILCMEIISETDFANSDQGFVPNYFVDISDFLHKKLDIVKNYESEIQLSPFPRSLENIEAMARLRGVACGSIYAESFRLVKLIE